MQKSKEELQAEIEADFKGNYEGIGLILFLNALVKIMHTRTCIFFATSIVPYTVGGCLWYMHQKPVLLCLIACMTGHLVAYFIVMFLSPDLDQDYTFFNDYEEILKELKIKSGKGS